MRKHLNIALIEAEALEARCQFAYARGDVPEMLPANTGLVRLLLERAEAVTRQTLDRDLVAHYELYAAATFTDRHLAESA